MNRTLYNIAPRIQASKSFVQFKTEMEARIDNDHIYAIAADGSTFYSELVAYRGLVDDFIQRHIAAALLRGKKIDGLIPRHELATVISVEAIRANDPPVGRLCKMMERRWAVELTEHGAIQLGSINYFRNHPMDEVKDRDEGNCLLIAFNGEETAFIPIRGGLNDLIFCCYIGDPDPALVKKFDGYDTVVEISDVDRFSQIISDTLRAKSRHYGECVYVRDRAIFGTTTSDLSPDFSVGALSESLGIYRSFLKSKKYSHQNEYRFIWRTDNHVDKSVVLNIPELADICRIVS